MALRAATEELWSINIVNDELFAWEWIKESVTIGLFLSKCVFQLAPKVCCIMKLSTYELKWSDHIDFYVFSCLLHEPKMSDNMFTVK